MIRATLLVGAALQARAFTQSAVWNPPAGFREKVLAACSQAGPKFGDCFAGQMKAAGASKALAFAQLVHNDAYLQAIHPVGSVAVASILYPFRANENVGLLLVNGEPSPVDVDDLRSLPFAGKLTCNRFNGFTSTFNPADRMATQVIVAVPRAASSPSCCPRIEPPVTPGT